MARAHRSDCQDVSTDELREAETPVNETKNKQRILIVHAGGQSQFLLRKSSALVIACTACCRMHGMTEQLMTSN